jgi:hypothetical protein
MATSPLILAPGLASSLDVGAWGNLVGTYKGGGPPRITTQLLPSCGWWSGAQREACSLLAEPDSTFQPGTSSQQHLSTAIIVLTEMSNAYITRVGFQVLPGVDRA